jgi:hypothetical protein
MGTPVNTSSLPGFETVQGISPQVLVKDSANVMKMIQACSCANKGHFNPYYKGCNY